MSPWCPSAVNAFMACPRKFVLTRQGTPERTQSVWSPGLLVGTAFHAGMAALSSETAMEWDPHDALEDWPVDVEGQGKAARLIVQAIDQIVVMPECGFARMHVVGSEVVLSGPESEAAIHGRYAGTADLVTEDKDGLIVTDYKTHWKREARYADAELRETQRSWQLKQYAWFAQEKYGKPVTRVRKILVYFTPVLKVWSVEYPVTPVTLLAWYEQAQVVWGAMDRMAEEKEPLASWQNDDSCERYGWDYRCAFYNTCWEGA